MEYKAGPCAHISRWTVCTFWCTLFLAFGCILFSMGPPHCIINEAPDSVTEKSSV